MEKVDHIDQVSVSMDGRELPVETERDGRYFFIRWSHRPINPPETLTFVLRYRVRGAIEMDQDNDLDSVTWEALFGNRGRGAIIERAVVTLRLPVALPLRGRRSFGVDADTRWLDARTVEFIPRESLPASRSLSVQVAFLHGLVDGPAPNWQKASWVFKKTRLTRWFPTVNWSGATDLIYSGLRFSVFGLIPLLFVAQFLNKRRWPQPHYPSASEGLTQLPSDLPAPVVSVIDTRDFSPQTHLSILVDLLQKGNLTITARSRDEGKTQSYISLSKQSQPDLPWEKVIYDKVDPRETRSNRLKRDLQRENAALLGHLDEYLVSRGFFDDPPLRAKEEQVLGCVIMLLLWQAAIIVGLGLGLWVNLFFSPWWAGTAAGVLAALVFGLITIETETGRIMPSELGVLEISRWRAFKSSLTDHRVNPDLDPDQDDPLLPYAVALNSGGRWINDINAPPPWFNLHASEEQTADNLLRAYRGFIGADSWGLDRGPKIKAELPSRSGGGGGGAAGEEVAVVAVVAVVAAAGNPLAGTPFPPPSPLPSLAADGFSNPLWYNRVQRREAPCAVCCLPSPFWPPWLFSAVWPPQRATPRRAPTTGKPSTSSSTSKGTAT